MSDDDLFDTPNGQEELPKDQWGRYKLPHPETGKVQGWTRVTTFAKSIADTYALSMWQQRMAMRGLTLRRDLYAMVAATPDTDRDRLNQLAEDAKNAASARSAANLGTAMHAFAERLDKGEEPAAIGAPPELAPILRARHAALAEHRIQLVPEMIERTVFVPRFGIVGTFDRWGWVGDGRAQNDSGLGEILDDKTGRDLTYGWNEIAIQLAAYANASHVLNKEIFWEDWRRLTAGLRAGAAPKTMPTRCWEPMPPTRLDRAIVIHMPVAQAMEQPVAPPSVTIYQVDIRQGWEAAQLCHDVREWRKRKGLAEPLSVTVPAKSIAARRQEIEDSAPCEGCGVRLDYCQAQRGKDPTAPPWFGCCARGTALSTPCHHVPDRSALLALVREAETSAPGGSALVQAATVAGGTADAINDALDKTADQIGGRPTRTVGTGCCGGWIGPDGPERCTECPAPDGWHPGKLDTGVTPDMVTRPPTWEERIEAATSRADLSKIWREATRAGEWTPALRAQGERKVTQFSTL